MNRKLAYVLRSWRGLLLALALALAGGAAPAQAAGNPAAGITCLFTSYALGFGNYDPSSASPTDGTGSVGFNCTDRTGSGGASQSVTVSLAIGAGSYGSLSTRQMQLIGSSDRLAYNIYRDSARSQIWGDGTSYSAGSITITGIPQLGSKTGAFTLYGRVPALQNSAAGSYTDYVTITVSP